MKHEDNKPVTRAYLKEVLQRVNESLQEYSRAIAKLQQQPQGRNQSGVNTSRLVKVEEHIAQLRQDIQSATQEEQRDDANQSVFFQQFKQLEGELKQLETKLEQLERFEKKEEYDQNTLERVFRQHEREFEIMKQQIKDTEYKLGRL